jgi:O-antigen/teichoic acid export membrane protein
MVGLAWVWPSVWALVIGSLVGNAAGVLAGHRFMKGISNRLRWDPSAARDLLGFGKFIFLSTLAGFFVQQGDKLFLGKFVSLGDLGVYNIGFFMAGFPGALGGMIASRILFPLYREIRPSQSLQNLGKIRRARNLLTGSLVLMFGTLALIGVPLIDLLYDDRYQGAGPMLVIMALMQLPNALVMGNNQLLLAEGDSRRFSHLVMVQSILYFITIFLCFWLLGLFGLILVKGLTIILIYPLQQSYLWRYQGTDIKRDAMFAVFAIGVGITALWINWEAVAELYHLSRSLAPIATGSWQPVSIFH